MFLRSFLLENDKWNLIDDLTILKVQIYAGKRIVITEQKLKTSQLKIYCYTVGVAYWDHH